MPADKLCLGQPGTPCGNIGPWRRGRCPDCARALEHDRGTAAERGYTPAWNKRSARIRAQHPTCQVEGCNEPSVDVHHGLPITAGGAVLPFRDVGLLAVCRTHHAALEAEARMRRR